MLDLEVAGSALRSSLWDVAIVVLAVSVAVLAVVACWWTVRECRRWVQERETIRRRLDVPKRCTCYRCGQPMGRDEIGLPHGVAFDTVCEACRVRAEQIAESVAAELQCEACDHPGVCNVCECVECPGHPNHPPEQCEACMGWGWILGTMDGGPTQIVSRCDACERFGSDAEARNHVRMLARGEDSSCE